MAYVIQQMENIGKNYPIQHQNRHNQKQSFVHQIKNNFIFIREKLAQNAGRFENFSIVQEQHQHKIVFKYIVNKIYKNLSLLFSIKAHSHTDNITISTKLLNMYNTFGKIHNRERRKLIAKFLCNRCNNWGGCYKLSLNVESGELRLETPNYNMKLYNNFNSITTFIQHFIKVFSQDLKESYQNILNVLFLTDTQFGPHDIEIQHKMHDKKFIQTQRFSHFMNVFLNLASENANEEEDINLNLRKESESFQNLKKSRIPFDQSLHSLIMFIHNDPKKIQDESERNNHDLNFLERTYISERLELPINQKSNNPNENFFVLNYIKVSKKLSQMMVKRIKVGGFTTIYLSEIEYWYVGSYCVGVMQQVAQKDTPPLKKYIIIKRQDKNVVQMSGKSRVAHERFILTKIKFGISMFLPKYYLLAEKDNSYQNDLLVDYISSPNLSEYIERNKSTLSFNTKIYFVLMIAQALRYLKEYKIAHLDLKPSNIMTYRRLTLKLIDFGESYHPQLLNNHQPGFSMPYSAPQNYSLRESYDSKSDVFSLGIIMYELFLGRYPFFFYDQTYKKKVYLAGNFLQHWMQSPEQSLNFGDSLIMPTIYCIINRCLRSDPNDRPQLEWITLLFREFIQCLK